jgi:hypothetical protein
MARNPVIDILRGILLLLMTMTHLPTVWSGRVGEPFGFISAAEGFVFMSAFLASRVFTERMRSEGIDAASRWALGRAWQLYLLHLALLLLAFTVIAWIAVHYQRAALNDLLDLYMQSPRLAVLAGVALVYQPPLLDILPLYIVFMAATAPVMRAAQRWGWRPVLAASFSLWVAAQFGLRATVHAAWQPASGAVIPLQATGAFDWFAWQLLWVLGLWFAAHGLAATRRLVRSSRAAPLAAWCVFASLLAWRHWKGAMGFEDPVLQLAWIDKWTLSAIRLGDFAALVLLVTAVASHLRRWRFRPLELIGGASQWVFVAHIASVLLLLSLVDEDRQPLAGLRGMLAVVCGVLVLFAAGLLHRQLRRRPRPLLEAGTGEQAGP